MHFLKKQLDRMRIFIKDLLNEPADYDPVPHTRPRSVETGPVPDTTADLAAPALTAFTGQHSITERVEIQDPFEPGASADAQAPASDISEPAPEADAEPEAVITSEEPTENAATAPISEPAAIAEVAPRARKPRARKVGTDEGAAELVKVIRKARNRSEQTKENLEKVSPDTIRAIGQARKRIRKPVEAKVAMPDAAPVAETGAAPAAKTVRTRKAADQTVAKAAGKATATGKATAKAAPATGKVSAAAAAAKAGTATRTKPRSAKKPATE